MKSKVLIETCAVGPLQETALNPSSPGGGVWLSTAPNLTSVKVRMKTALELWKDEL